MGKLNWLGLGCALWLVLASVQAQTPPPECLSNDMPCEQLFDDAIIESVEGIPTLPIYSNPALQVDVRVKNGDAPQVRVYFPAFNDGIYRLSPTSTNSSPRVCELILVGFADEDGNYTRSIVLQQGNTSARLFAYCRSNNLPKSPQRGSDAPINGNDILQEQAQNDRFSAVTTNDSEYQRLVEVFTRARDGLCPDYRGQAIRLNDFTTQLAVFIIHDEEGTNPIELYHHTINNPLFTNNYHAIYCLLNEPEPPLGASLQAQDTHGIAPMAAYPTLNPTGVPFHSEHRVLYEGTPIASGTGEPPSAATLEKPGQYVFEYTLYGAPFQFVATGTAAARPPIVATLAFDVRSAVPTPVPPNPIDEPIGATGISFLVWLLLFSALAVVLLVGFTSLKSVVIRLVLLLVCVLLFLGLVLLWVNNT